MQRKLMVLTAMLLLVAGSLLAMRQQELQAARQSAVLHGEIRQHEQDLWNAQAGAARLLRPRQLQRQIDAAQLVLEPAAPRATSAGTALAGARLLAGAPPTSP
ncbi:MAG: hypothetical protein OER86_03355 [Phycisphaerae bacterium]|nr:hypothetical protein [Phycisphaerae bacterium]